MKKWCIIFFNLSMQQNTTFQCLNNSLEFNVVCNTCYVATLALGLWPRQGCGPREEARESHLMLPRVWRNEHSHSQVSSHFGSWSAGGLPKFQRAIARVKTHWIEELIISLERSWNLYVLNGLAWPIWTFETQIMAKRRVGSQIGNLSPDH
jgi:hypothetical protein